MDLQQFLRLANEYARLGDAIGSQLTAVADGDPLSDKNPNALMACRRLLKQLSSYEVDGAGEIWSAIDALGKE